APAIDSSYYHVVQSTHSIALMCCAPSSMADVYAFFTLYRHLHPSKVKHTIHYIHKACALRGYWLCQQHPAYRLPVCTKPLRPFFFLREKRNKKTWPLPPQQEGDLLSWLV